jgi:hypothetical protein
MFLLHFFIYVKSGHEIQTPKFNKGFWVVVKHATRGKWKKGKVAPVLNYAPRNEDVLGEWKYSSMHSTSALKGSVQLHAPAALPSGKEPVVPII